jgi:tetratricopeptide (TPR) repeat protein
MELSGSEASSVMTFGSANEMPEDPVEEPVYLGRKREKFYKIILSRGDGIDKPGTLDEVVLRYCSFTEDLENKDFSTVFLGKGALPDYLEKGIVSMKANEVADLHVPAAMTGGEEMIVKVEVKSFVNIHDLHADGMLVKKVIQKSSEISRIGNKDEAKILIEIRQGREILMEKKEMEIIVGVSEMDEGLVVILTTMKLGEKSEITVNFGYFQQFFSQKTVNNTDPVVEIEVLALDKLTDIYVNGSFYKKILVKGDEKILSPYPNSCLEFTYELHYGSITKSDTLICFIDECKIPSLWEDTLKLMKVGEHSRIECVSGEDSFHLRDSLNDELNCPVDNPVLYFKLHKIVQGAPLYEMEDDEKVAMAARMKITGNELFKRELWGKAIEKYDNGVSAVNPVKDNPDMFKAIYISLQLNIANCFCKLKEYRNAIVRCDRILEAEPDEYKAFYRKGIALKLMCEYAQAIPVFEKGLSITQTGNIVAAAKDFQKELQLIQELLTAYHKKEKKMFSKLFA